ncbi:MAG: hypothetical protein AB7G68_06780 [Nitrospiraceae bacterium]
MLHYLRYLLFGRQLCAACHRYSAIPKGLCLYCVIKQDWLKRAA